MTSCDGKIKMMKEDCVLANSERELEGDASVCDLLLF